MPFSSAIAMGVALIPYSDGITICISGKARPIMSASTNGIPSSAATTKGVVEFNPPASTDIVAVALRPRKFWMASKAVMISVPRGIFSTITVGAPIMPAGITSASSSTSLGSSRVTGPLRSIAAFAMSLPMYGSPPPPVPSTAAPSAISSSCEAVI